MNKLRKTLNILNEDYKKMEIGKAIVTSAVFFFFPVILVIGLLIVFGTIYPYWNMQILIGGSVLIFLYGLWTNKLLLETLKTYHDHTYKELSFLALFMQLLLLLAIILVDVIVVTTIF